MCPTTRDFSARQGNLTRQSLVDCKENERGMVGKGPPFWHVDIFKHDPGAKKEQDLFPSKVLSISGGKALKFSFPNSLSHSDAVNQRRRSFLPSATDSASIFQHIYDSIKGTVRQ